MPDLGRDDDILATSAEGAPDQLLRDALVVRVGGIDEVDTEIEGAMKDRSGVCGVRNRAAESVGAKANDGNLEPGGAESPVFHVAGPRDLFLTQGQDRGFPPAAQSQGLSDPLGA